jgi:hypothetical protein
MLKLGMGEGAYYAPDEEDGDKVSQRRSLRVVGVLFA